MRVRGKKIDNDGNEREERRRMMTIRERRRMMAMRERRRMMAMRERGKKDDDGNEGERKEG